MTNNLAGGGIEALAFPHRVLLDPERDGEQRWERVGELKDTEGGHDRGQTCKVWNTSGEDEGDTPVHRNQERPNDLSGYCGEAWSTEDFNKDVVVDD